MKSVDVTSNSALLLSSPPLSSILKNEFSKLKDYSPQEDLYRQIVKKSLLTPEDTKIWIDTPLHSIKSEVHRKQLPLDVPRKLRTLSPVGQISTAHPALNSRRDDVTSMEAVGRSFEDETVEVEQWICCDLCNQWRCGACENLSSLPTTDIYLCIKCQSH